MLAVPRESLISVTLHPDTTEINQRAFLSCFHLTSITIPSSVTSIGNYAFYNCTSMTNITIPDSVTSIGDSAFGSCTRLATVTIDSGDIYKDLTSDTACGDLIENADTDTIRVLANIIDSGLYTNTYLNGSTFSRSDTAVDGYYVFTRK